jgi:hypothetical protein
VLNTHFQGEITELQVAESFLALGYQVCKPLVSDSRYDFIVDINHQLYRIQVKTASLSEDGDYIEFKTQSSHTNTQKTVYHSYSATTGKCECGASCSHDWKESWSPSNETYHRYIKQCSICGYVGADEDVKHEYVDGY